MKFLLSDPLPPVTPQRLAIRDAYRADEDTLIASLLTKATLNAAERQQTVARARDWINYVRGEGGQSSGLAALLQEYNLTSREGVVLMCLAEAFLRVPDGETADKLLHDKLSSAHWEQHLRHSHSLFVNAATWGLVLGNWMTSGDNSQSGWGASLHRLVARLGEPVMRTVVRQIVILLGESFVLGQDVLAAMERAGEQPLFRYSYDMLGEAALTMADADKYCSAYLAAIHQVGQTLGGETLAQRPSISVKLSALHPRYEFSQRDEVMRELFPRLQDLCVAARDQGIGLTLDAEEADRLELQIDLLERLCDLPALAQWGGLGLAVQAYQKRAYPLIEYLIDLADRQKRCLMVRLVKGAYWDSEIKDTQTKGLADYPVFTHKAGTDVSYLACARRLLAAGSCVYPQFATHNAYTIAAITAMASGKTGYEFQRLHGMGQPLYGHLITQGEIPACRVYAPVGHHDKLLAYLVRRLLENGANSSFVRQLEDESVDPDVLVADPVEILRALPTARHPKIPLPANLYSPSRQNSRGMDMTDPQCLLQMTESLAEYADRSWRGGPIVIGQARFTQGKPVYNPAQHDQRVGEIQWADREDIEAALASADAAAEAWERTAVSDRADQLDRIADLYEANQSELLALCVREAGKTLPDALAEVREAIDFCRYYAAQARQQLVAPTALPGPTGETNELNLRGRGPFVCISPWNFPLAIFTGQVVAALVAGNPVLAKPAEQTSLIASRAVALMHQAGIPVEVLHLLPGPGEVVGARLITDLRIKGVVFTGGSETARTIAHRLADRQGPIIPLIAETGGQNAMIVDSTALPEQVIRDVLISAFQSAGQRCSALRVLYLQEDIADALLGQLYGAMAELKLGDPAWVTTDIGPVIDADAQMELLAYCQNMARQGRLLAQTTLPPQAVQGYFVAPTVFAINSILELQKEVFGPILHVVRYPASDLDRVIDEINAAGYGLTLGIHSRIDATIDHIVNRVKIGNIYVNRSMIGAVVGSQPFGGEGLSGTGFKAGGPHYLLRFVSERVVTTNTTASGGNASLLMSL